MKKNILFLAFILAALASAGQDTTFHIAIGTPGVEDAVDLFETEEGFLLFGSAGFTGSNQSDIYVVRLSKELGLSDIQTIGTAGIEKLAAVCEGANHSFVLASQSYNGYDNNDYDVRLDVMDSVGDIVNTLLLGQSGLQVPLDIISKDQEIFLLMKNADGSAIDSYSVIVFDFELNELNTIEFLIADSFGLNAIEIVNNSLWLTGEILSEDSLYSDLLILKMSMTGEVLLQKNFGGVKRDFGSAILVDSDSTLVVTGSSNSYDSADYDSYVIRMDTMMNMIWFETFGFFSLADNKDDFGVITISAFDGKLYNGVSTRTYGQGEEDFIFYQMTIEGVFEEGNSFGLQSVESLRSVIQSSDSNYYLFGTTNSTGSGQSDLFLVKTPTASVGPVKTYSVIEDTLTALTYSVSVSDLQETSQSNFGYIIYSDLGPLFKLNNYERNLETQIYNVHGQLVRENLKTQQDVSFQGLHSGVYFLIVGTKELGYQKLKVVTPTQ